MSYEIHTNKRNTYSLPSATATLPMYSDPMVIDAVTKFKAQAKNFQNKVGTNQARLIQQPYTTYMPPLPVPTLP